MNTLMANSIPNPNPNPHPHPNPNPNPDPDPNPNQHNLIFMNQLMADVRARILRDEL